MTSQTEKKHDRAVTVKTVWLPLRTVSEMNVRTHWSARAKRMKTARRTAAALCPASALPCTVTMTRHSAGTLDDDNLRSALKGVRDGIADRLGVDDASPAVEWRYEQAKAKRGEYAVHIRIEEKG
jgi:hypothetical protein